jgi:hypothetical protein
MRHVETIQVISNLDFDVKFYIVQFYAIEYNFQLCLIA